MRTKELAIAVQAGVPVLLWGPPGCGKSSSVLAMAEALGLPCEVVISSIREPTDFSGLPFIQKGEMVLAPPAWAARLARAGRGILFLDEINTAPPAVQAALLRVVLDRAVGDLQLPPGISVVAAANPTDLATGGWDLGPSLANRFCHIEWTSDPMEWVSGMISGWPTPKVMTLPENWENGLQQARGLVASFIRHRLHLVSQPPRNEEQAGKAWPSERSWNMAARLLAAAKAAGAEDDVVNTLVAGCVGDGPGLEFMAWARDLDLPDPEDLLSAPDKFTLPSRGDRAFAVLTAVVTAAVNKLDKKRWGAAWKILASAAAQGGRDVAAVAAKNLAAARKPNLPLPQQELREFIPILKQGGLL